MISHLNWPVFVCLFYIRCFALLDTAWQTTVGRQLSRTCSVTSGQSREYKKL